jgi:hypothetical protein
MASPAESASLILKLYELRREEKMREARDFMVQFDPQTFEEFVEAFMGPNGNYVRMVASYWEMSASLVLNKAIDAKMFDDANGEHILVFSRLEPFLPQAREMMRSPRFMKSLEEYCLSLPDGRERIDATRERMRYFLSMRAQTAKAAS